MSIEYLGTHHKCRCRRCGQVFFTDVGNAYQTPEPPPPHLLKPKCPTCGQHGKLRNQQFELLGIDKLKARRSRYRTYTEQDCSCGQVSTASMAIELGRMNNHVMTLKLHCERLVQHWRNDYRSAIMCPQMRELERVLREISQGSET